MVASVPVMTVTIFIYLFLFFIYFILPQAKHTLTITGILANPGTSTLIMVFNEK